MKVSKYCQLPQWKRRYFGEQKLQKPKISRTDNEKWLTDSSRNQQENRSIPSTNSLMKCQEVELKIPFLF